MEKLGAKKAILERVQKSVGATFEYDKAAIASAYDSRTERESSFAIKILSIFGGILGALMFVVFIGVSGLYDSEKGLLTLGAILIVGSVWMNVKFNKLIIDTFSISTYSIGLILVVYSLHELGVDINTVTILICFIALCSLFVTQNFLISFIAILVVNGGILFLIIDNGLHELIHLYIATIVLAFGYVLLNEATMFTSSKMASKLYKPLRIGLLISFLIGLVTICAKNLLPVSEERIWLSSVVMIAYLLFIVYRILQVFKVKSTSTKIGVYSLCFLLFATTFFAPSISGALIIILLCFLVNYKTGFIIGIVALIYFVGQYYYDLNFTLLTKSLLMLGSGVIFLLLYVFTSKKMIDDTKI